MAGRILLHSDPGDLAARGHGWRASFLLPNQGYWWYFWKLPQKTATALWSACGLHATQQLVNFALIYYAQTRVKKYTNGLHPANIWTLSINGISVFLDFL